MRQRTRLMVASANPLPADILANKLEGIVGPHGVIRDLSERVFYSTDLLLRGAACQLVVRPTSVENLAEAVRVIAAQGFAIVPRGAGLTYVGGYSPPHSQ